jgi:hypothetical protein
MPRRKKDANVKEVPVSLVRRYQLSEKVCPVCGQTFMGTKKAKYDRLACRQKANYDRHAREYRQYQLAKYHRQREQEAKT